MPLISPFAAPHAEDPADEPPVAIAEPPAFAANVAPLTAAHPEQVAPSVEPAAAGPDGPNGPNGPDGLVPETNAQDAMAESQVLAGIEAFRAQLAEMKQQSVAAAE